MPNIPADLPLHPRTRDMSVSRPIPLVVEIGVTDYAQGELGDVRLRRAAQAGRDVSSVWERSARSKR